MIGPTTYFVLSKKSDGEGKPPAGIPRPSVNFSVSGAMDDLTRIEASVQDVNR